LTVKPQENQKTAKHFMALLRRLKAKTLSFKHANSQVSVCVSESVYIVLLCVGHFVNQRAITRTEFRVVCKCIKFIFHLLSCIKQTPKSKLPDFEPTTGKKKPKITYKKNCIRKGKMSKKLKKEKHNAESLFHLAGVCVCVCVAFWHANKTLKMAPGPAPEDKQ